MKDQIIITNKVINVNDFRMLLVELRRLSYIRGEMQALGRNIDPMLESDIEVIADHLEKVLLEKSDTERDKEVAVDHISGLSIKECADVPVGEIWIQKGYFNNDKKEK